MKTGVKTGVIAVRIDPDLKERAETLAKQERRSVSSWVEVLIAEKVAALDPSPRKRGRVMADQRRAA
jgi:predicted transcriptional regulator